MVSRAGGAPALATVFLTRVAFFDRIEERFIPFDGETHAICNLHFDHLRRFNRIHGIEVGDNVLRSMAIWLRSIAEDGLVARYGGDGFVAFVRSELAEGLADDLNARLLTYGKPEGLCAQIGAAVCVRNTSPVDCVDRACFAYETIRESDERHFRLFDAELERVFDIRYYVVDHLDDAIARGEIRAWAQPICRVLTGQICEVEILARWESERFGFLRPDQFVPELERHALIHKLDLEKTRLACKQWTEAHALSANVPFGINLSHLDFELCDIYQHVRTYMRHYGVPVGQVHIEVTESITARDDDVVAEGVRRFREAGFSVYMDDFGTGYSSLGTMASLRFDVVKIDKSLVDHVTDDERARAVLADTVAMVKRLGMQTLCEGVETEEQLQFLRAIGCEKAQGYLIRRPCSHADVMETLVEQSRNHEMAPDEVYFDTVGKINLLDGSSPITHGVEAVTFMGHSPIAVLEFSQGKIKLLTCNYAYQRLLHGVRQPR